MKTPVRAALLFWWNVLIAVLTIVGLVISVTYRGESILSARGWQGLRYFTTLSNLLECAASVLLSVWLGRRQPVIPRRLYILKYVAAAAVALTFIVVAMVFGPFVGLRRLYLGGNFWFHLVIPVLAISEFVFLDRFGIVSMRETLFAPLPALIYGIYYILNVTIGRSPKNDFYGFAHWGLPIGFAIFAAILLLSWIAGLLLRWGNRAGQKPSEPAERST